MACGPVGEYPIDRLVRIERYLHFSIRGAVGAGAQFERLEETDQARVKQDAAHNQQDRDGAQQERWEDGLNGDYILIPCGALLCGPVSA